MNRSVAVKDVADFPGRPFHRVAARVANKVSELFRSDVLTLDENRTIITGPAEVVGQPLDVVDGRCDAPVISVPVVLGGEVGEVVICGLADGETISERLARVLVEMAVNEITANNWEAAQVEFKHRFVLDLLLGQVEDEARVYGQAEQLGLDLAPPRSVILLDAADYIMRGNNYSGSQGELYAHHRAQCVIRAIVSFFHLPSDLTCAYVGNGQIVVLKAADSQNLREWINGDPPEQNSSWANLSALKRATRGLLEFLPGGQGQTYFAGIGRYQPGLKGLARSYEDARAALTLGQRFGPDRRVHCLDELGVVAFVGLAEERTKIDLALHLLSPLDSEPELMETLAVFLDMGSSPSRVASQLSIHRNTLSYRLDKITLLTGLDPRRFDDAVQMRLALVLRAMASTA